jgi:hypothetical protein
MDWEATPQVASGKAQSTKQAEWVSKDVIDQRKKEGHCLRCGKDSHFIKSCPYKPAKRPESRLRTSAAVEEKRKEPPLEWEPDSESDGSDESGKE